MMLIRVCLLNKNVRNYNYERDLARAMAFGVTRYSLSIKIVFQPRPIVDFQLSDESS